jgi:hypothetical protein
MKQIKYFIGLMAVCITTVGCLSDLDTAPNSQVVPSLFFRNLDECEVAVNGIYDKMAGSDDAFGQYYVSLASLGSHVSTNFIKSPAQNTFAYYTFNAASKELRAIWASNYSIIYRANQCVDRITELQVEPGNATDEMHKNRLVGEAKFLRALAYFNLVRFWGGVPLVLDELEDFKNTNRPRTDATLVYDAIVADLKYAEEHLYNAHWVPSTETALSYGPDALGKATKGAAKGLLAKVYLTRASHPLLETEFYESAYEKANEVVSSGDYILDESYSNLFTVEGGLSHEWMFQVQHDFSSLQGGVWGGVNNPPGKTEAINKGFGRVNSTYDFFKSYEENDPRRDNNICRGKLNADNSIDYKPNSRLWYCYKFKFSTKPVAPFQTDMNVPVLRYGDVVMVLAEAAAKTNRENEAYDAVDLILSRAQQGGISPSLIDRSLTGDSLLEELFNERAREMCFEGSSWFDLVREGETKFLNVLADQKFTNNDDLPEPVFESVPWAGNAVVKHLLFPIPVTEMETNSGMAGNQNPGY